LGPEAALDAGCIGGAMLPARNFAFLKAHDAELMQLGVRAEQYFHDDPVTALFKLRQFAELLCKIVAAHHAVYVGEREAFEDILRRLFDRILPRQIRLHVTSGLRDV
jgi:type I restriction enzyme R subunit